MRKEIDNNPKLICRDAAGLFLVDVATLLDGRKEAGGSTPAHDYDDVCTFPSNDDLCGDKLVGDNKVPTTHLS